METNKVLGRLTEFARLLSIIVGKEDFFLCWEDTDREHEELENSENGETIPAYFPLSIRGYASGIGHISPTFIYHKETNAINLVLEHYANDDFTVYKHKNLEEMTEKDVAEMLDAFNKVSPIYSSIMHVIELDEQKKPYYREIERVTYEVLGWE